MDAWPALSMRENAIVILFGGSTTVAADGTPLGHARMGRMGGKFMALLVMPTTRYFKLLPIGASDVSTTN